MARRKCSLRTYRKKRDFSRTPEPAPAAPKSKRNAAIFVVHKHDARRLHFDLRLEIGGALASWAIPKGPSFDPRERRLAVQTEDHPLDYAGFEGRIPDGEYGAGDSIVWDRGTWETVPPGRGAAMREKGHVEFVLHGEKLVGRWHLVRTRGGRGERSQWLIFKAKDEFARSGFDVIAERPESVVTGRRVTRGPLRRAAVASPHPAPIALLLKVWPPELGTLVPLPPIAPLPATVTPESHVFELKYDGYRAVAGISGGRVALQSRSGLDLSRDFPVVTRALAGLEVAEAVLDGEIVAFDAKGVARFQKLQNRDAGIRYMAFDLLWLDGDDLRGRPLEERRELLESVLANLDSRSPLALAARVRGDLESALAESSRRGAEGLIAKRHGSPYRGARSRDWLKLKLVTTATFGVLGFTPISNGTAAVGALLLGTREKNAWRYAGKVGAGFTDRLRRDLFHELSRTVVPESPDPTAPRMRDARWVRPTRTARIAFTEWTDDHRLRHPVLLETGDVPQLDNKLTRARGRTATW